jgi:MerR family transcriptional regulator, thiopeptide resistance regulator
VDVGLANPEHGEMYVADPRFAANYGGAEGAAFVRDALLAYVAGAP